MLSMVSPTGRWLRYSCVVVVILALGALIAVGIVGVTTRVSSQADLFQASLVVAAAVQGIAAVLLTVTTAISVADAHRSAEEMKKARSNDIRRERQRLAHGMTGAVAQLETVSEAVHRSKGHPSKTGPVDYVPMLVLASVSGTLDAIRVEGDQEMIVAAEALFDGAAGLYDQAVTHRTSREAMSAAAAALRPLRMALLAAASVEVANSDPRPAGPSARGKE